MDVKLKVEGHVMRKDPLQIELDLKNNAWLPIFQAEIAIRFVHTSTNKTEYLTIPLSLDVKSVTKNKLDIQFDDFGYFEMTCEGIKILGLFEGQKKIQDRQQIIVFPKLYKVNMWEKYNSNQYEASASEQFENVSQMAEENLGVRPYQMGDNLRQIHWKLSAKNDELLVSIQQQEIQPLYIICLDDTNISSEKRAILVEVYLSIMQSFIESECIILTWIDGRIIEVTTANFSKITLDLVNGKAMGIASNQLSNRIVITANSQNKELAGIVIVLENTKTSPWSITVDHYENDLLELGRHFV